MTTIDWNIIDKVIFINLDKRKDRRVRIVKHLKKIGVPKDKIVRLDAVEYSPGYIGCSLSHIAALEMAQQKKWERVLVLEDDFSFCETEKNFENVNDYFNALNNSNWHVAFLAANYKKVTPLKSVDYIVRVDKAWCACAYIVNSSYYDKLIHNYRSGVFALLQGGSQHEYALDVNWHSCMQEDLWLGIFPNSGYQLPDKSDIEGVTVDYKSLFNKPLSQIVEFDEFKASPSNPIKVDFYFQRAAGWTNFESIFEAMQENDYFDCQIVALPDISLGAKTVDSQPQRDLLIKKGISFIDWQYYSLTERLPNVAFLQNPYDEARPGMFSTKNLRQHNVNIAYTPYGSNMGNSQFHHTYSYNLPCHNLARWIFVRSERHKREFGRYCSAGNGHVYVTGHPKFDHYAQRYGMKDEHALTKKRKTILWDPHFVPPTDEKMFSTFNIYASAMLKVMAREDINIIIRPHPLFKQFMDVNIEGGNSNETAKNFHRLMEFSEGRENVVWDFSSDYSNAFAQSDALMADLGSFLIEYLPSKKPILYLTHENCIGLDDCGNFIYDNYDVAYTEEDIVDFVDNVVNGIDPHKESRLQVLKDELYFPAHGAGKEISNIIFKDFTS